MKRLIFALLISIGLGLSSCSTIGNPDMYIDGPSIYYNYYPHGIYYRSYYYPPYNNVIIRPAPKPKPLPKPPVRPPQNSGNHRVPGKGRG